MCFPVTIPIGFTLSYYDIPLISHASNSIAVNDKNTYNTLMRMGFGFKYIGEAFVDVSLKCIIVFIRPNWFLHKIAQVADFHYSFVGNRTVVKFHEKF